MACTAVLLASIFFTLLPTCFSNVEVSSETRWFVRGDNSSTPAHGPIHYDRQFDSLDLALTALSSKTAARNVVLLLGRGKHIVNGTFFIDGAKSVTISSEERDRNSVFLNVSENAHIEQAVLFFCNGTNITLSYLTARLTMTGGVTLFQFESCNLVVVEECSLINSLAASSSLDFHNCNQVFISHSTFLFTVNLLEDRTQSWALSFRTYAMFPWKQSNSPLLTVSNCIFRPNETVPFVGYYKYSSTGKAREGTVTANNSALVYIALESKNMTVMVHNCQVDGLVYAYAIPVIIHMAVGSINNTAIVSHVNVTNNKCIVGCGITSSFSNGSFANTILITDSTFTNNTAVVEGGAGLGYFNDSSYSDDPQSRNFLYYKNCEFTSNKAVQFFGGGSAFISFSTSDNAGENAMGIIEDDFEARLQFKDCKFVNNLANRGTVYVKNSILMLDGFCEFINNTGSAICAHKSVVTLSGRQNFFSNSARLNGGALLLERWSRANFHKVHKINFVNNSAPYQGGAIYVDRTSSSETLLDMMNTMSGIDTLVHCFLQIDANVYFSYDDYNPNANVQFVNNVADNAGRDVYAATFRLCNASSIAPFNKRVIKNMTYPIASSATFMLFHSASCKCYKIVSGKRLDFTSSDCTRHEVIRRVNVDIPQHDVNEMNSSLSCWNETAALIFSAAFPLSRYYFPRHIFPHSLWVPFGDCLISKYIKANASVWMQGRGLSPTSCYYNVSLKPSSLTLNPSPGERFSLRLDSWDDFFKNASSHPFITIQNEEDMYEYPQALLRHAGTEYGTHSPFYFDPLQPITDLSIVGPVGARGLLYVGWQSFLRGHTCPLSIPFELADCHAGYDTPLANNNANWTKEYIANSATRPVSKATSMLECRCSGKHGIYCDSDKKTVTVRSNYWAGVVNVNSMNGGQEQKEFSTHVCTGLCSHQSGKNYWTYDPAHPNKHCYSGRKGVLCGSCIANYSEVPASMDCKDCRDSWRYGLSLSVALIFILGAILVVVAMKMSLLDSPIFESWVFFIQTLPLVLRPEGESLVNEFAGYTVSVFQLNAPWCILPDLESLERLAFRAVPSVYLFFLVLLLFLGSYITPCARYIKRARVADTFLLVLIVAYEPLATFALFSLSCTVDLDDKTRLLASPTVVCFSHRHLPYAVIAIGILSLFLLPLPLILLFASRSKDSSTDSITWLQRVARSCASRYHEHRQWWIAVSLWRRLAITALAATVTTDITSRQGILFVTCLSIFLGTVLLPPYKTKLANNYEFLLSATMTLIAAFSITDIQVLSPAKQVGFPIIILVLFAWPTVAIVVITIYRRLRLITRFYYTLKNCCCGRKARTTSSASISGDVDDSLLRSQVSEMDMVIDRANMLRDPLLQSEEVKK